MNYIIFEKSISETFLTHARIVETFDTICHFIKISSSLITKRTVELFNIFK